MISRFYKNLEEAFIKGVNDTMSKGEDWESVDEWHHK